MSTITSDWNPQEGPIENLFVCPRCFWGKMFDVPPIGQTITCEYVLCGVSTPFDPEAQKVMQEEMLIGIIRDDFYFSFKYGIYRARLLAARIKCLGEKHDLPEYKEQREMNCLTREDKLRNANRKALPLLVSILTPRQRRELFLYGSFTVYDPEGNPWKLVYARHGNCMKETKEHLPLENWCGHIGEDVPIADLLLAQKLMIEQDPTLYTKGADLQEKRKWKYVQPEKDYLDELEDAMHGHEWGEKMFNALAPDPTAIVPKGSWSFTKGAARAPAYKGVKLGTEVNVMPNTARNAYRSKKYLRKASDPILLEVSTRVTNITKPIKKLIKRMKLVFDTRGYFGLSAVELGVTKRIICIGVDDEWVPTIIINPEITSWTRVSVRMEACASMPGNTCLVHRPQEITIEGFDETGMPVQYQLRGTFAASAQHEIDHLNGILITDRAVPGSTWFAHPFPWPKEWDAKDDPKEKLRQKRADIEDYQESADMWRYQAWLAEQKDATEDVQVYNKGAHELQLKIEIMRKEEALLL